VKSIRLLHTSLLGLLGGVLGWSLLQSGFNIFAALTTKGFSELNSNWIYDFNYEGSLIGLGLGLVLQARASILNHHELMDIFFKMFIGAFLGAILGLICFGIGNFLIALQISPSICRIISWTLLGLSITGTSELFCPSSGFSVPRIISGGIGGIIGGSIFELLLQYHLTGTGHLAGLVLAGFSIFLIIGIAENRVTSFGIKVLSGKQEGQIFLLDQNRFSLGYGSQNNLILRGYAEVCDRHAQITKKGDQNYIESSDTGGDVLVNYRLVDQQSIKKGDVIKIGTALMQYYEI
tara:strand:- start:165 stop:1040 length:876 start_codon:yes stop_codon:yes gene_type:complete